jgi:hypothetical protein
LGLAWLTCLAELWLSVSMATLVAIMAPLALARIYFR